MRFAFQALGLSILLTAVPTWAHHSFAAQYDATKVVTMTGKVTKVEWTNPHIYFFIDVPDEKTGKVTNWALEFGGPNSLMRLGWTRNTMKPDDVVTVEGTLARDGSNLANARSIIMKSTGKRLFAGSSEGTTP